MTSVKGVIREVGRSKTTRISAARWYGSTTVIIQNEETGKTYTVNLSAHVMKKCNFLPRVGIPVVLHGFVEDAEYGLSDYYVSKVTSIKREGAGVKAVHKLNDD